MTYQLNATIRNEKGTGASRRLRHQNKVPAIIYGKNKEPVSVVLAHNEIFHAIEDQKIFSSLVELVVDGKKESVQIKALQRHPYKPKVTHVDFMRV
ncbi:50S ribosomal protein L25 [Thiotrichales bacterium 19S3-7]|nr:50S ribosomal protein L25 [Thiotrichales bacterium 19S3-7]MCF6802470.1 50S ribosomal protein L25 [Thiotrichales bacterium 19S3-11]